MCDDSHKTRGELERELERLRDALRRIRSQGRSGEPAAVNIRQARMIAREAISEHDHA